MTQIEALFFVFKDLDLGSGNIWDVTFKLEVLLPLYSLFLILQSSFILFLTKR